MTTTPTSTPASASASAPAPILTFLAVQHNEGGRPCGWGASNDLHRARNTASQMYASHRCYPGEEMGKLTVYRYTGDAYDPEGKTGFIPLPEKDERCTLVIARHGWGKGNTFESAKRQAFKAGAKFDEYLVYDAPADVMVDGYGGTTMYPTLADGSARKPITLLRHIRKGKDVKDVKEVKGGVS